MHMISFTAHAELKKKYTEHRRHRRLTLMAPSDDKLSRVVPTGYRLTRRRPTLSPDDDYELKVEAGGGIDDEEDGLGKSPPRERSELQTENFPRRFCVETIALDDRRREGNNNGSGSGSDDGDKV